MPNLIIGRWLILAIILSPSVTWAARYSTEVGGFIVDPSGEFTDGLFDFGFAFSQIDSLAVEVLLVDGLSNGYCTGSSCISTSLDMLVFDPARPPDSHVYFPLYDDLNDQYPDLYASFSHLLPNRGYTSGVSPPNSRIDPKAFAVLHDPWPNFLLSGRGAMRTFELNIRSGMLNDIATEVWTEAPSGLSFMRLIVNGSAVPEPSTIASVGIAILVLLCRQRK